MVKIDFEFESEHGTFRDSIVLPDDHAFTDEQIDATTTTNWASSSGGAGGTAVFKQMAAVAA